MSLSEASKGVNESSEESVDKREICFNPVLETDLENLGQLEKRLETALEDVDTFNKQARDAIGKKRFDEALSALGGLSVILEGELQTLYSKLKDHRFALEVRSTDLTKKIVKLKNERSRNVRTMVWMAKDHTRVHRPQNSAEKKQAMCDLINAYSGDGPNLTPELIKRKRRRFHVSVLMFKSKTV